MGILASESPEVSVAGKEIIPSAPEEWTKGHELRRFSLLNYADCTLLINNEYKVFLKSKVGFSIDNHPITSLKILEDGVEFIWVGDY